MDTASVSILRFMWAGQMTRGSFLAVGEWEDRARAPGVCGVCGVCGTGLAGGIAGRCELGMARHPVGDDGANAGK